MPFLFRTYYGQSQFADQNLLLPSATSSYIIDSANIIAYYPFDTDFYNYAVISNTVPYVNDITNNSPTYISISTANTTKLTSGAALMSSINTTTKLSIPYNVILINGFTIAFWLKANSGHIWTTWYNIIWMNGAGGFTIQIPASNDLKTGYSINGLGGSLTFPSTIWNDNNWHHYCLTLSSIGNFSIYFDGNYINTTTTLTLPRTYINDINTNMHIFGNNGNSGSNLSMNSFVLFNRALNSTEIGYLFNYPNKLQFKPISINSNLTNFPGSTCILYFPFNNDTSNYATGSAVSTNITIGGTTGATLSNTIYKVGTKSLYGSTTNNQSYLQVLNLPTNNNGYTFACWAYFTSFTQGGGIFIAAPSSVNTYMGIFINNGSSFLVGTGGVNWITVTPSPSLSTNKWYHFAITITKTTPTLNVYLNGINVALNITTNVTYSSTVGPLWICGDARGYYNSNSGITSCPVYIDDFRYYDGVLTQDQIVQLYYYI